MTTATAHNPSPAAIRFGAWAGWLTLASIIACSIVAPQVIAGQRVTATFDAAAIRAYYAHSALVWVFVAQFVFVFFYIPFVVLLRQVLSVTPRAEFLAMVGAAFAIAAVPMYLAGNSVQATLVGVAAHDGDIVPLFRFWDVLYNSATYTLEAGYTAAFALAMRDVPAFPRWMPNLGIAVGVLQVVNASALFLGIPDAATIVGNLALLAWFVGASVGLGRVARAAPGGTTPAR